MNPSEVLAELIEWVRRETGITISVVPSRNRDGYWALWCPEEDGDVRFDPLDYGQAWWTLHGILYGVRIAHSHRADEHAAIMGQGAPSSEGPTYRDLAGHD